MKEMSFQKEKGRLKDQRQVSLIKVKEWRDEQRDGDQMGDCSIKQEQIYFKICLQFEDEWWEKGD